MQVAARHAMYCCLSASAIFGELARAEATGADSDQTAPAVVSDSGTELDYVLVQGTRLRDEVSIGRTTATLREIPQSITIMGQARIEAQNLRSLDEVLIQTPGIILGADSSIENTYYSRGHVIESIQYDGLTTRTAAETMASPNMAMFDGVEILRGSNGVLNGINGFGSINMRRKRPLSEFQASTAVTAGSWNRYHGEIDVTGPLTDSGDLRGRFVGSYDDKEYFYPFASFEETLLYGTIEYDITPATTLRLASHWQDTDALPNSPGVPFYSDGGDIDLPRDTMLSPAWSNFHYDTKNYFGELTHEFENAWQARLMVNYFDTESSNDYAYHWGPIDRATGLEAEEWGGLYGEQLQLSFEQFSFDFTVSGPVTLFGREHEILAGVVRMEDHYSWYYGDTTALIWEQMNVRTWDPRSVPRPPRVPADFYGPDAYEAQTGVFGRIALSIADPLTVVVGARVNYWKNRDTTYVADGSIDSAVVADLDGDVSPQLGIIYDLNSVWSLYASYADLLTPQNAQTRSGSLIDPIIAANYEVGIKGELFGGKLNAAVALFRVEETNRAQADTAGPPIPGEDFSVATGKTRSEGIDIELNGQAMPNWNVEFGYTYNTSEFVKDEVDQGRVFAPNTPKHIGKLWSNWRLPFHDGRWSVSGGVSGQSKTEQPFDDLRSMYMVKSGYVLVNLRVGARITDRWSASVNLHNALDKKYYAGSVGTDPAGNHFYGDPRNVVFALRGKF